MGCVPMPGPQFAADHLSIDRWNELRSLRRKAMNEMGTYERRMHFDRLCQLRALYQLRGEWDSTPTLSIEDAVAYAEHLHDATGTLAEILGPDAAGDELSTTSGPQA